MKTLKTIILVVLTLALFLALCFELEPEASSKLVIAYFSFILSDIVLIAVLYKLWK